MAPHRLAHVPARRPNIQYPERLLAPVPPSDRALQNRMTAEVAVDPAQIREARRDIGIRRSLKYFRQDSSAATDRHNSYVKLTRVDIVTGNLGWIEVICGPMFSGKSEELIRRLRRAIIARKRVQVFKPVLDVRYSDNEIVSHADQRLKANVVNTANEMLEQLDWRTEVIGVDESNFFGMDLIDTAHRFADAGKQVIIAGLDTDYMGRPFHPMPELLCVAESITKTLAICMRCGNPAKHTQRLVESDDLIVVGAAGMYEARCRRCFEAGIPKQEAFEFARPKRQTVGSA